LALSSILISPGFFARDTVFGHAKFLPDHGVKLAADRLIPCNQPGHVKFLCPTMALNWMAGCFNPVQPPLSFIKCALNVRDLKFAADPMGRMPLFVATTPPFFAPTLEPRYRPVRT